jgi:hypothetical protein
MPTAIQKTVFWQGIPHNPYFGEPFLVGAQGLKEGTFVPIKSSMELRL